jgi:asparagine N-glycosylation enzyme membrane subunit Stt3
MGQLDQTLHLYLHKKAPAMPEKWQNVLVAWLPWITLVILILALPAVLALFGLSLFVLPVGMMVGAHVGISYILAVVFLAVTLILEAMAIPGLFKRQKSAWKLLYYSALLSALYNLLSLNLFGLIIGTLISLYLLFQIEHHYN